jgi:predicted dienelactone hydrolase
MLLGASNCKAKGLHRVSTMRKLYLLSVALASLTSLGSAESRLPVGVTNREFLQGDLAYDWRGAKTHALVTTIWYPADAQAEETPQWVGDPGNPLASAGRAAVNAKLATVPVKFPLILLSHGTGGSALMMAWMGTELAAHGYITAAVNHPGNNALEPYTVQGFTLGWKRAEDLSKVLDGMLADPQFRNRIDGQRIGAAGFSLGGYTMIVVAGGIGGVVNMENIIAHCSDVPPSVPECTSPPEFPDLVQKAIELFHANPSFAAEMKMAETSHRDPRIKAIFAIAPLGHEFSPESLEKISIPVEIVAGAGDRTVLPANNAQYLAAHIRHAKLAIYPGGVVHYTFLDTCSTTGMTQAPEICVDPPGVDRDAIHFMTIRRALAFFHGALKP